MTTTQKQAADALYQAVLDHDYYQRGMSSWLMQCLENYREACKEPEPVEDWMSSAAHDLANYISPEGTDPEEFEQLVNIIAKYAPRPDPQAVTARELINKCYMVKGLHHKTISKIREALALAEAERSKGAV